MTFANSGAEAVEAAIKLCRAATGRVSASSRRTRASTARRSEPSPPPATRTISGTSARPRRISTSVPFGDTGALRRALAERPGHYAAFLVEPIQGEGGIVVPPPGYLAGGPRRSAARWGCCSSWTRSRPASAAPATLFACEAEGVVPDVMALAKALGGGLVPIGAVLCTERGVHAHLRDEALRRPLPAMPWPAAPASPRSSC